MHRTMMTDGEKAFYKRVLCRILLSVNLCSAVLDRSGRIVVYEILESHTLPPTTHAKLSD